MKRWTLCAGASLLFLAGSLSFAGPLQKIETKIKAITPYANHELAGIFEGGKRTKVLAIGDGQSFEGLYVFDVHGNCVAHDESSRFLTRDDLAVDWIPGYTAEYLVEVRNFGQTVNQTKIVVR